MVNLVALFRVSALVVVCCLLANLPAMAAEFLLKVKSTGQCLHARKVEGQTFPVFRTDDCRNNSEFIADNGNISDSMIRFRITPEFFACLHVDLPAEFNQIHFPVEIKADGCTGPVTRWLISTAVVPVDLVENTQISMCMEALPTLEVVLNHCNGSDQQTWDTADVPTR
jgi:hypothetical protein